MHLSSSSPTLPANTPMCTYCHSPILNPDLPSITAMVQEYSLPVGLCLRCTLDVLEDLKLPLDESAPLVAHRHVRPAVRCRARGRYAVLLALAVAVYCKAVP